jgi:hypothetical protein
VAAAWTDVREPDNESEALRTDLAALTEQVRMATLIASADREEPSFATRIMRIASSVVEEGEADAPTREADHGERRLSDCGSSPSSDCSSPRCWC